MGGCRICGRRDVDLISHHVVPLGWENNWGSLFNRGRIWDRFGFGFSEHKVFLCRGCHKIVHRWLEEPRNMLFMRVCELCGENILIGFDGEVEVSYELNGKRRHYDSAEVQIEAFKKDSKRV